MVQNLNLKQKGPGGKEFVSDGFFKIMDGYLQPSTATSAADAARAASELAPKSEEGMEDFLWTFWRDFIGVAEQIPYDHPAQDQLARVVRELSLLPDAGIKVWDVSRSLRLVPFATR